MRKILPCITLLAGVLSSWCFAETDPIAANGTIAVVEWAAPDPDLLERLGGSCSLLAYSQDLAVVLVPSGYAVPAGLEGILQELEPFDSTGGSYYLFHVADAGRATFAGRTRTLARCGRTVLLWSADGAPRLTIESEASLGGIKQPSLISLDPKAPPSRPGLHLKADDPLIEFDPLIAGMVAAVDRTEYTGVWQALDDYETRYSTTPQVRAATEWIAGVFTSYGLEVETFLYRSNPEQKNVIGTLRGLLEPSRVVYITAHFDSTSNQPTTHAPGADDNASGTAAVMEAARVLSGHRFRHTIKFAAFNGEEQGMVGSAAYCAAMAAAHEDVLGCFNFDMIAYTGKDPLPPDLAIYVNPASTSLGDVLAAACTTFVPEGVEPEVIVDAGVRWSDHASFWDRGWKALTGIEAGTDETEFCPWYHTPDDRIEKYGNDYPTHVTTAAVAAVAHTAIPIPPDDCNDNGILDFVELATGAGADCDANGIPDDCDIAAGASLDCNGNGVPDACDIAAGTVEDLNGDGIPDVCVPPVMFRRGDSNEDATIDIGDAICILGYLFGDAGDPCGDLVGGCLDAADANDDGAIDLSDAVRTVMHLFAASGPLPPPFGECGTDPTEDGLGCESAEFCP